MSAVARRLNEQLPAVDKNRGISVVHSSSIWSAHQSRLALWMLGGAVFFVFLIAAANVTSLRWRAALLARARWPFAPRLAPVPDGSCGNC